MSIERTATAQMEFGSFIFDDDASRSVPKNLLQQE